MCIVQKKNLTDKKHEQVERSLGLRMFCVFESLKTEENAMIIDGITDRKDELHGENHKLYH